MGYKRARPVSATQLLVIALAPSARGFVRLPVTQDFGFITSSRYSQRRASFRRTASAVLNQDGVPDEYTVPDLLPRTMEELYQQMRDSPPINPYGQYEREPGPEEMVLIERAIVRAWKPMEDDSWWEENGEEWDRVIQNPKKLFESLAVDDDGGITTSDVLNYSASTLPNFQLSSYKAGGRYTVDLRLTPFAQSWDSLPDLHMTKRVYAQNSVDRMAAIKYLMNCTCSGLHGSAETHQVSRGRLAFQLSASSLGATSDPRSHSQLIMSWLVMKPHRLVLEPPLLQCAINSSRLPVRSLFSLKKRCHPTSHDWLIVGSKHQATVCSKVTPHLTASITSARQRSPNDLYSLLHHL